MKSGRYLSLAVMIAVICVAPVIAQLQFNPNINGGVIQFEDTEIGETSREWVTFIGQQDQDVQSRVTVTPADQNLFGANPAAFVIEPGQEVAVTFEFRPGDDRDYETQVRITCQTGQGREIQYFATMRGTGIEAGVPEISVIPNAISLLIDAENASDEESVTLRNRGDAELVWSVPAFNAAWLTVIPRNGRLAPDQSTQVRFRTNDLPDDNGEYQTTVHFTSNDAENNDVPVNVTLTVNIPHDVVQTLHLRNGWNLISLNVSPNDGYRQNGTLAVESLIAGIADRVHIVKNFQGSFCLPSRNFWGIAEWNLAQGYWIRTTEAFDWEISGEQIPADTQINLQSGWNAVAYYPTAELRFEDAFADLLNQGVVLLIKNGRGQFCIPSAGFGLGTLALPGDGLQIRLSQNSGFRYPGE